MSCRLPPLPRLALAALAAAAAPALAQDSIKRCVDPAGRSVFTDRRCSELGAVPTAPEEFLAPAPSTPDAPAGGPASGAGQTPPPGGCPRTPSQLAGRLNRALATRDGNRLSSLYDWVGVSGRAAARVLDRLERIAARPVLGIVPVLSAAPASEPPPAVAEPEREPVPELAGMSGSAPPEAARWLPDWMRMDGGGTGSARGSADEALAQAAAEPVLLASTAAPPPAPPPPRTVGLRVEQALPGTATPARTVFGLQRRFGCLWLKL